MTPEIRRRLHPGDKGAATEPTNLNIGLRYRVDGILHEYLGEALVPDGVEVAFVFLRNEWRPGTPGQLPSTIVDAPQVGQLVTKTRKRD